MTETTTPTQLVELPPVVPEGADCVDDLHVIELASISRAIGCDVAEAIAVDRDGARWDAFMRLAWTWAKRTDPHAKLATYGALRSEQLLAVLRLDGVDDAATTDPDADGEDVEANPTDPAPVS